MYRHVGHLFFVVFVSFARLSFPENVFLQMSATFSATQQAKAFAVSKLVLFGESLTFILPRLYFDVVCNSFVHVVVFIDSIDQIVLISLIIGLGDCRKYIFVKFSC